MCSVVLPVYLLARRVVRPGAALAAAALAVALPSLAYVGTVMTENVFYPVFAWLVLALVLMLERPTLRRQLTVLALGARLRHACAGGGARRGSADRAGGARLDRAGPAETARRLQAAVRDRRARGPRGDRR